MAWVEGVAAREAAKDCLKKWDFIGEVFAMVATVLVFLFFIANQVEQTGFFTSDFGTPEMLAFYGSLMYGVIPPFMRIVLGRRNVVRPFEFLGNWIFVIAGSYLLLVFPFDFNYLTALFPEGLRFLLDWITNDIAQLFLSFAIIIAALVSIWTIFLYIVVRDVQRKRGASGTMC